jgi:hypothetical protein
MMAPRFNKELLQAAVRLCKVDGHSLIVFII